MHNKRPVDFYGRTGVAAFSINFLVASNGAVQSQSGTMGVTITGTNDWTLTFPEGWARTYGVQVTPQRASAGALYGQVGAINAAAGTIVVRLVNGSGSAATLAANDVIQVSGFISDKAANI